ncbi:MAG: hypothetical protein CM15mP107_1410 [Bacteroidota bacterium]|nr:MAG: hypothetical protein CM15mP107_1410 [Bacteroidota bacterium]
MKGVVEKKMFEIKEEKRLRFLSAKKKRVFIKKIFGFFKNRGFVWHKKQEGDTLKGVFYRKLL